MATSTLASRNSNRLTPADIASVKGSIANAMRTYPTGYQPTIGADFNSLQRGAYREIGCVGYDLRESEVDEIADVVLAAILGTPAR